MVVVDRSQLESHLEGMGLYLVEVFEAKHKKTSFGGTRGKVSPRDLLEFSTHMFTLLDAEISLADALKNLSEESPNLQLRATLRTIHHRVEAGSALNVAMSQHPNIFPPQITNLVQAGEESDTLAATFKELERYLDWVDQIRSDVRQATIYPTVVIAAVIGLLILLFTFVVPQFIPVLESLDVPLPFITVMVFNASLFLVDNWYLWLPLVLGLPLGWWMARTFVPGFSHWRDRMMLELPIFGNLFKMLTLSKFVQNFAVLYKAGIPVLQCLKLCQALVGNQIVADAIQDMQHDISEGSSIHDSLRRHAIFPPMMVQMIAVGEATGNLPKTLMNVADYYNKEIPRRVKKIFTILEPVITLGLISIVGVVALALFMPMMSLMSGF